MTNEELRDALEPFAQEAAMWSGRVEDDREIVTVSGHDDLDNQERFITVGDLRRLARIYEELSNED
jgi:hypothetical protein